MNRLSGPTDQEIWDNLPTDVKSLLCIALLDVWGAAAPTRQHLQALREEAEASLATAPAEDHFDILCRMASLRLLEFSLPTN